MAVQVNFTLRRDSSKKSASIVTVHNRLESSASSSRFESWLMYTVTTALAMLVIGSCVYHVIIYCRYYKHGFQKLNTSIFFDAYDSKQKLMRSSFKQGYNSASSDEDVEDYSLYNVGHWQCEKPTSY